MPGGALPIRVVDLAGGKADNPQGMLGAIVPYEGATWFVKLTGPRAIVAAEKGRFLEFLTTIRSADRAATAVAVAALPPPPEVIAASAAIADLRWSAPPHWQSKPASNLRKATYVIPGAAAGPAELAITAFPGAVGGELANVNRWRAQLQLPPLDTAGLATATTRFTVRDLPVVLVDFAGGPDGSVHLLGAIVPYQDATWFFKLTRTGGHRPCGKARVSHLSPISLCPVKRLTALLRDLRDIFVSLKLTVVLLLLSIILILVATLDQVNLGIWVVQAKYFNTFIVYWPVGDLTLAVFPGGYTLGGLLLLNLFAAHAYRFTFSWRKLGIWMTHAGLVLLLVGQLLTGLWQDEYQLRIDEGGTKNYSESYRNVELAITDTSDPKFDEVVAIPEGRWRGAPLSRIRVCPSGSRCKITCPTPRCRSLRFPPAATPATPRRRPADSRHAEAAHFQAGRAQPARGLR